MLWLIAKQFHELIEKIPVEMVAHFVPHHPESIEGGHGVAIRSDGGDGIEHIGDAADF
jgi:hypothetical protein